MILILLLILGSSIVRQESCDMIELHHMHDTEGKPIFEQVIFWNWHDSHNKYHVRAWRIIEHGERPEYRNRLWRMHWLDNGLSRLVVARHYRESWLQRDPERDDKREWPEMCRVALRK